MTQPKRSRNSKTITSQEQDHGASKTSREDGDLVPAGTKHRTEKHSTNEEASLEDDNLIGTGEDKDNLDKKGRAKTIKFQQWLILLERYKKNNKHCDVSYKFKTSRSRHALGRWVNNVRSAYRQKMNGQKPCLRLTDSYIDKLKELGFDFKYNGVDKSNHFAETFYHNMKLLAKFKKENGHMHVPDGPLRDWKTLMKQMRSENDLDVKYVEALDLMGFTWETNTYEGLEMFISFQSRKAAIPRNHPCFRWCEETREKYRNNELSAEDAAYLEICGFPFDQDIATSPSAEFESNGSEKINKKRGRGSKDANLKSSKARKNHKRKSSSKERTRKSKGQVINDSGDEANDSDYDSIRESEKDFNASEDEIFDLTPLKRNSENNNMVSQPAKKITSTEDDSDSTILEGSITRSVETATAIAVRTVSSVSSQSSNDSGKACTSRKSTKNSNRTKTPPTLQQDERSVFPSATCSFCKNHSTHHYCLEKSSKEGQYIYSGNRICGKPFCHECKLKVESESTTICPDCLDVSASSKKPKKAAMKQKEPSKKQKKATKTQKEPSKKQKKAPKKQNEASKKQKAYTKSDLESMSLGKLKELCAKRNLSVGNCKVKGCVQRLCKDMNLI